MEKKGIEKKREMTDNYLLIVLASKVASCIYTLSQINRNRKTSKVLLDESEEKIMDLQRQIIQMQEMHQETLSEVNNEEREDQVVYKRQESERER